MTNQTTSSRATHRIYAVTRNDKQKFWRAIGALWPHGDGKATISGLIQAFQTKMNGRETAELTAVRNAASTKSVLVDIILLITAAVFMSILYFVSIGAPWLRSSKCRMW